MMISKKQKKKFKMKKKNNFFKKLKYPFLIAEISANHNGKFENAYKIIDMAKTCGADAIKIQTYKADTITINHQSPEFFITGGLWEGRTLYEFVAERAALRAVGVVPSYRDEGFLLVRDVASVCVLSVLHMLRCAKESTIQR